MQVGVLPIKNAKFRLHGIVLPIPQHGMTTKNSLKLLEYKTPEMATEF